MGIPLCAECFTHGAGERDWVGSWQCVHCGDRVKDEILECPFCAQLALETEMGNGKSATPPGGFSVPAAARVLGVTQRAVRQRCNDGRLEAVRDRQDPDRR